MDILTYAILSKKINSIGEPDEGVIREAVSEYLVEHPVEESDPTVPNWAKAVTKPTYTAQEVGAASTEALSAETMRATQAEDTLGASIQGLSQRLDNIYGMDIHICTVEEYNLETRHPIIQAPVENTFYLVPSGGESPDMFEEWVYTGESWELFGSANVDLTDYIRNTDFATTSVAGVVKIGTGLTVNNGMIALNESYIASQGYAKMVSLTQAEYDVLETPDESVLYIIKGE